MAKFNFAIIVPTRNRIAETRRLMQSIAMQSVRPNQVIVVDSSDAINSFLPKEFSGFSILYIHTTIPGLTRQRNIGLSNLYDNIDLVCFMDDDAVFRKNALEHMLDFWAKADSSIGGVGFNAFEMTNVPDVSPIKTLFHSQRQAKGLVLRSGFHTQICPVTEITYVNWILGGCAVWRRNIFNEFIFDEWFEGYGLCEDLDFSYRVGKKYKLVVIPDAECEHYGEKVKGAKKILLLGTAQITNRFHIVKKDRAYFSITLFFREAVVLVLKNLIKGIFLAKTRFLLLAAGNALGFFEIFTGTRMISQTRKRVS